LHTRTNENRQETGVFRLAENITVEVLPASFTTFFFKSFRIVELSDITLQGTDEDDGNDGGEKNDDESGVENRDKVNTRFSL